MAGFLAVLGGAGQAAQEYGQQVRSHLEARRTAFAQFITKMAEEEDNPTFKGELHKHVADLYNGVDMNKIAPAVMKTAQAHAESRAGLAKLFSAQQPKPAAGAGISPTLQGVPSVLPDLAKPGSAAQPQSSPVQPNSTPIPNFTPMPGATQPIQPLPPPVAQAAASSPQASPQPPLSPLLSLPPGPVDTGDIYNKYRAQPEWHTPAGFARLKPLMEAEVAHNEGLRQQMEQAQFGHATTQALIQSRVAALKQSGDWDKLSPRQRTDVQLGSVNITPELRPIQVAGAILTPPGATDPFGNPITTAQVRQRILPDGSVEYHPILGVTHIVTVDDPEHPGQGKQVTVDAAGHQLNDVAGGRAQAPGMYTPHQVTAPNGQLKFLPPAEVNKGNYVSPAFAPTTRTSSSTPTAEGGTVTSTRTQKGSISALPAPSAGGVQGPAPVAVSPAPKPSPSTPMVKPFNESVVVDKLAKEVAQDSTNWNHIGKRGPFSAENPSQAMVNKRMVELGIDPNNATGSMKDRAATARTILPHLREVNDIIAQAEKDGDLGLVATRWNNFLTNKVGKDVTKSQVFTKLATNLDFLTTAAAMAHGGARAGASEPLIEHWRQTLQAADPATLKAKLAETYKWMEQYAQMVGPEKPVNITPLSAPQNGAKPSNNSDILDQLRRDYIRK